MFYSAFFILLHSEGALAEGFFDGGYYGLTIYVSLKASRFHLRQMHTLEILHLNCLRLQPPQTLVISLRF
jgi:hypothetical protein